MISFIYFIYIITLQASDIYEMQAINQMSQPENYGIQYYYQHQILWANISTVALDGQKIVGYVQAKLDDEPEELGGNTNRSKNTEDGVHGHITSVAVLGEYRHLGLAKRLMLASQKLMQLRYNVVSVTLHVRKQNASAIHLYTNLLQYKIFNTEVSYYSDGEDAYEMRIQFPRQQ